MRPRSHVTGALLRAAHALHVERLERPLQTTRGLVAGAVWTEIADRAQVVNLASPAERRQVQELIWQLARRGELSPRGEVRLQGIRRPLNVYVPGECGPSPDGAQPPALWRLASRII